jgi:hypothetical protein
MPHTTQWGLIATTGSCHHPLGRPSHNRRLCGARDQRLHQGRPRQNPSDRELHATVCSSSKHAFASLARAARCYRRRDCIATEPCAQQLGAHDCFRDDPVVTIRPADHRGVRSDSPSSGRDRLRWPGRGMSWTVVVARRRLNVTALVNDRAASRARRAWRLRAAVPGGLP